MRNHRGLISCSLLCLAISSGGCASASRRHADSLAAAEHTAFAYTHALYTGHIAEAERFVVPHYRSAFAAITVSLGPHSLSATHLRVGDVRLSHDDAVAVMEGTLCSTATKYSIAQSRAAGFGVSCRRNDNPTSADPGFSVRLQREAKQWFVTFLLQPQSGA
jgi:hypothetical protein